MLYILGNRQYLETVASVCLSQTTAVLRANKEPSFPLCVCPPCEAPDMPCALNHIKQEETNRPG